MSFSKLFGLLDPNRKTPKPTYYRERRKPLIQKITPKDLESIHGIGPQRAREIYELLYELEYKN